MNDYILFDLDGTLTDSKIGITSCVQYALKAQGIIEENLDKLEPFIGPPLKQSFMEFYQLDEKQAEEAIVKYRERYSKTGLYENQIYKGIPAMLRKLKRSGAKLAVASSKPAVYVEKILKHFHIAKYFDVVVGSELDGRRIDKQEVVEEALCQLFDNGKIVREKCTMVGDRKFDIEGAAAFSITSVGVTYGYGGMQELKEAKADYIVRSVEELEGLLLRGSKERMADRKGNTSTEGVSNQKAVSGMKEKYIRPMVEILLPIILYYIISDAVRIIASYLVLLIGTKGSPLLAAAILVADGGSGEVLGLTGNASAIVMGIAFLAAYLYLYKAFAKMELIEASIHDKGLAERKPAFWVTVSVLLAIVFSIGLNVFLNQVGLVEASDSFQQISDKQMSVNLIIGIVLYGIISPLTEETIFRGILFNKMRKYFPVGISILVSSLFFGLYHGNPVQIIYGTLSGCLFAYLYAKSGRFYVTVILHGVMNVVTFLLTEAGFFQSGWNHLGIGIVFLLAGIVAVGWLHKITKAESK